MDSSSAKAVMPYRYLGNTGLKVSLFSYGNWITTNTPQQQKPIEDVMLKAYESGVNLFDTAQVYGSGAAQKFFGEMFKKFNWRRQSLVVSTKLFWGGPGVNDKGLSRKHILEGMDKSLKRLQLQNVDIVFCHRPDKYTPIQETVRAMNYLIKENKTFYWGTSEWSAAQIVQAYRVADKTGLIPPVVQQPQYHMLWRDRFEKEYEFIFRELKYGTTIWSPLASGILTGKYNSGEMVKGTRLDSDSAIMKTIWSRYFNEKAKPHTIEKLNKLGEIAKGLGYSQAQLALAWAGANQDVSTVLVGASKLQQFDENLKALELIQKWNHDIDDKIEAVLGNRPEPQFDARSFGASIGRRSQVLYSAKS